MSAIFSSCGKFRYSLGRRWSDGNKLLGFVMLNPSTADAEHNDATIRRCIRFAQSHGYDAMEVVNLYAHMATRPIELRNAGYPVGPDNDAHIVRAAFLADAVCVAWGANEPGLGRSKAVMELLRQIGVPIMCLAVTRGGYPQHPLYLPAANRLRPFGRKAICGEPFNG